MPKRIVSRESWIAPDFVPETFGRLTTVSSPYRPADAKSNLQDFFCFCGKRVTRQRGLVKTGNTKSCGCLKKINAGLRTHGKTGTPEHKAWKAMCARCYKVNGKEYHNYGGRGIGVWDTWRGRGGFELWFAEIGPKPSPELTQERKDVNKGYIPGNVRWATWEEQANNTRRSRRYTAFGKTLTAREWSNETGLSVSAIKERMKSMDPEEALTIPIGEVSLKAKQYTLNGKTQSLPAWCRELGIKEETARGRLRRGEPVEKMLETKTYNNPRTILLEAFGERLSLTEWSEKVGLSTPTIYGRITLGYSPEEALTLPPRTRKKKIKPATST